MIDFEDRVVVITGAAQGIGLALAKQFVPQGAILVLADNQAIKLRRVVADLKKAGAREIYSYECDIADERAAIDFATSVANDVGPVNLLCAHAGVGVAGGIATIRKNSRDWAISVNINGLLNTIAAFLPGMQVESEGERHIMITASMASFLRPRSGQSFYAMTKYAALGIAEGLRADLSGTGIRASVLCPGLVNTRTWASIEGRPERFGGPYKVDEQVGEPWQQGLTPEEVAQIALAGLRAGDFFIFAPHFGRGDEETFHARLEELRYEFSVSLERQRRMKGSKKTAKATT